jgi:hypothetical protein
MIDLTPLSTGSRTITSVLVGQAGHGQVTDSSNRLGPDAAARVG